jgi:hypothetical protein
VDVGLVKGANERDKVGLPRLMEALESNMWSTMRRHPSAAKKEKEEKEKKRDSQVLPVGSDKGEGQEQEQEQGEGVEPGKQQQQQQGEEKSTNTASPIATATVNVRAIPAAAPKSSPAPETAAAAGPSCSEAPPAVPPLPPSAGTGSMDSPAIARYVKSMEEASTRTQQSSEADSSASSGTKVKRTEDLFNGELPDLESNVEVDQYSQLFSKVPLA